MLSIHEDGSDALTIFLIQIRLFRCSNTLLVAIGGSFPTKEIQHVLNEISKVISGKAAVNEQ
tara:strand:+ start:4231 stop:4416 length:186 start_codon:yes stop_codon:yes gene_type:complete